MNNSLGNIFKITSFGESHGASIGIVIDGCPAGLKIDNNAIQNELDLRKPGTSILYSERKEEDAFEIISGMVNGYTSGHPICIIIPNKDTKQQDYDHLKQVYRPSHADFTYDKKYNIRNVAGGGRSSARITAGWVAAGSIASQLLSKISEIKIHSFVKQIHNIKLTKDLSALTKEQIFSNAVRCPDEATAELMEKAILQAKKEGNSLGGIIHTTISNVPIGLGEPVFQKISANLGKAMLSINAVKGFEIGSGFDSVFMTGKEHNDSFIKIDGAIKTKSNHSGGIQGGISNGMPITFNTAFKPTSTIQSLQETVSTEGKEVELEAIGRHDPCVVPRAVPIINALSSIIILDHIIMAKGQSNLFD